MLFAGVFVAGVLLGRSGHEGLVPSGWVEGAVGGEADAEGRRVAARGRPSLHPEIDGPEGGDLREAEGGLERHDGELAEEGARN